MALLKIFMRTKCFSLLTIFVSTLAFSQGFDSAADQKIRSMLWESVSRSTFKYSALDYSQIDGSPYLLDQYQKGSIVLKDGSELVDLDLRYNAVSGYFEYRRQGKNYLLKLPELVSSVRYNSFKYVFTGERFNRVLFQTDNYLVLVLEEKNFIESKEAKVMQQPEDPKFSELRKKFYYYVTDDDKLELIKFNKLDALLGVSKSRISKIKREIDFKAKDESKVQELFIRLAN